MDGNTQEAMIAPASDDPGRLQGRLSRLLGIASAGTGLLAGLVAFFAASCCALPLIFVILGMGGAWLSIFDVLLGIRIEAVTVSAVIVALGWMVFLAQRFLRRRREGGSTPPSLWRGRVFRLLVLASTLVAGAWLINEFQGDITRSLFELRAWVNE